MTNATLPRRGSLLNRAIASVAILNSVLSAYAGGWCYKVGECEAWQLKLAVEESDSALCKVGWPGIFEYPTIEPECFYSETPVDGYDFIPGPREVPLHRCERPVHEVNATAKDGIYDLGQKRSAMFTATWISTQSCSSANPLKKSRTTTGADSNRSR